MSAQKIGQTTLAVIHAPPKRVYEEEVSRPPACQLERHRGVTDFFQGLGQPERIPRELHSSSIRQILSLPGDRHGQQARDQRRKENQE